VPPAVTPMKGATLRAHTARRVRAARGWANMSQPALAEAVDMSLASLRRIEQEKRDVSTAELIHIGEVCQVPRKFMLYGWTDTNKSTQESRADALEGIITDMAKRLERHEKLHEAYAEGRAPSPDMLAQLDEALTK
jgi:transcriptional regulator with XRE-family HTH domain